MTCRCRAEFCMICGAKWKSCDCPWFSHAAVESDRLQHIDVAPGDRRVVEAFPRPYHVEMEIRREQERRDEELARRLQVQDINDDDEGDNDDDDDDDDDNVVVTVHHDYTPDDAPGYSANNRYRLSDTHQGYRSPPSPPRPPIPAAATYTPPIPTPPPAPSVPIVRQHSRASRLRADTMPIRAFGRASVTGRVIGTDAIDDNGRATGESRRVRSEQIPTRVEGKQKKERRSSAMAGLTKNTTVGRINEWRRYVEEDESVPVM